MGLQTPGVYSIPCEYGQVYIGQTGSSIETRIKENHQHIWLGQPDKLAVAKHRFNHNHLIKFQDTWILSTVPGYTDRLIRVDGLSLEWVMKTSLLPPYRQQTAPSIMVTSLGPFYWPYPYPPYPRRNGGSIPQHCSMVGYPAENSSLLGPDRFPHSFSLYHHSFFTFPPPHFTSISLFLSFYFLLLFSNPFSFFFPLFFVSC